MTSHPRQHVHLCLLLAWVAKRTQQASVQWHCCKTVIIKWHHFMFRNMSGQELRDSNPYATPAPTLQQSVLEWGNRGPCSIMFHFYCGTFKCPVKDERWCLQSTLSQGPLNIQTSYLTAPVLWMITSVRNMTNIWRNSSWWLNQPIWKIWSSNWIISPLRGRKKNSETTNQMLQLHRSHWIRSGSDFPRSSTGSERWTSSNQRLAMGKSGAIRKQDVAVASCFHPGIGKQHFLMFMTIALSFVFISMIMICKYKHKNICTYIYIYIYIYINLVSLPSDLGVSQAFWLSTYEENMLIILGFNLDND